jgi:hypothetical protein
MSWSNVVTVGLFIVGAVVCIKLGNEHLAMLLAGAAAGYSRQSSQPDRLMMSRKHTDTP